MLFRIFLSLLAFNLVIAQEKTQYNEMELLGKVIPEFYSEKIPLIKKAGKAFMNMQKEALKKGIKTVDTEFLCIFNADGSFNPKELGLMINKLRDDKYDFVFASRYEKNCGSDDDTLVTLIGNYIFTFLGKIFFKN